MDRTYATRLMDVDVKWSFDGPTIVVLQVVGGEMPTSGE